MLCMNVCHLIETLYKSITVTHDWTQHIGQKLYWLVKRLCVLCTHNEERYGILAGAWPGVSREWLKEALRYYTRLVTPHQYYSHIQAVCEVSVSQERDPCIISTHTSRQVEHNIIHLSNTYRSTCSYLLSCRCVLSSVPEFGLAKTEQSIWRHYRARTTLIE